MPSVVSDAESAEDFDFTWTIISVFLPILPPKIKSVSIEERRDYEAKLHNRCRVTGEKFEAVVKHIRDSFDADLLKVFCELQLNEDVVDMTEALSDIKCLFKKELKMNLAESDCIRYTHPEAEKDSKVLFRLIVEKATELERQHIRLKCQRREAWSGEAKPKDKHTFKSKNKRYQTQTAAKSDQKASAGSNPKPKSSNKPSPPPGPCPKCDEMHWLRECPVATEVEKAEPLKHFRNGRKSKKAKTKRLG
ncbi:uncharacterized protein PITG_15331 [Phytophthora infestans T30-4]|uniref:Uncharacterized protein n=1 Tax=Phytophthora infestans (strain T30-4) TaxID=403677 RepID=D0NQG3_PHYIT|nr:uncharacterized protein PITG_15331 [Phytophthora infestans T30-4]EEY62895.1 hypothetical protein PITG_15331 [Phytophthora infestans T30-4]|eukprot:XP_002898770.1 hypothetical protein PITG_15331 [Phytophthora infestans T30-4]